MAQADDDAEHYSEDLGILIAVMPYELTARRHARLDVPHFVLVALFEPTVAQLLHERGADLDALRLEAEAAVDALPHGRTSDDAPFETTAAFDALLRGARDHTMSDAARISLGHVLRSLGAQTQRTGRGTDPGPGDGAGRALAAIADEHLVRSLVARVARTPLVASTVDREPGYRDAPRAAGADGGGAGGAGAGTVRAIVFDDDRTPMDLVTHLFTHGWGLHPTEARMLMMRIHVAGSAEIVMPRGGGLGDLRQRTVQLLQEWGSVLRIDWR